MHLKFWLKTALYLLAPQGLGHYRKFRRQRDPNFDVQTERAAVREKHHGEGGWKEGKEGDFRYRDYASYDEYLEHQKSKLDEILKAQGGFSNKVIVSYRLKFYRRFRHLKDLLPPDAQILCLGARQGTEVEVLRDIGFRNAWGIDLNPGPDNPWVKPGDFMNLDAEDSTLDLIYSNCVDHAFDLDAYFREHSRALKPAGYALYDLALQEGGAFEAVEWDQPDQVIPLMLQHFHAIEKLEVDRQWKWMLLRAKG